MNITKIYLASAFPKTSSGYFLLYCCCHRSLHKNHIKIKTFPTKLNKSASDKKPVIGLRENYENSWKA